MYSIVEDVPHFACKGTEKSQYTSLEKLISKKSWEVNLEKKSI